MEDMKRCMERWNSYL